MPKRCFWYALKTGASERYATRSLGNRQRERQQNSSRIPRTMPKRCLRNVLTAELTSIAFGGPLPKQPNSSKWHAQHQEWNLTWNVQHQNYRPKPLAEHFRNSRAAVARRAFGKNLDSSKLLGALPLSKSKGSADIRGVDIISNFPAQTWSVIRNPAEDIEGAVTADGKIVITQSRPQVWIGWSIVWFAQKVDSTEHMQHHDRHDPC